MIDAPPRAWYGEEKKMLFVNALHWTSNNLTVEARPKEDDFGSKYILGSDEVVLLQSTGLKDKNGKMIYGSEKHGDIIKYFDWIGVVHWLPWKLAWGVIWKNIGRDVPGGELLADLSRNDLEIIGNELQNPELLTEKPR